MKVTVNKPGASREEREISYAYNSLNQLTRVAQGDSVTTYEYDAVGNQVKMVRGGGKQVSIYEYDDYNRLTAATDPLGQIERYEYDLNGNLLKKIDRKGNVKENSYDRLNRLTGVRGTETSLSRTADNGFMKYTYAANGLLLTEENEHLKTTYEYDGLGRTSRITESGGTVKEYGYDLNNNRTSFRLYINGSLATERSYGYDRLDRMVEVKEGGKVEAAYTYTPNGNRESLVYGNGVRTDYGYNRGNMVTSLRNSKNGVTLSSYGYSYYLDGNQAEKRDHTGLVTGYTYDLMGRLLTERETGGTHNTSILRTYGYDSSGNRRSMTVADGEETINTLYEYDLNDRLLKEMKVVRGTGEQTVTSYTYDPNGNQTMKLYGSLSLRTDDNHSALTAVLSNTEEKADNASLAKELQGTLTDAGENRLPRLNISLYNENEVQPIAGAKFGTEVYTYDVFNRLVKVEMPGRRAVYEYRADGLRISKTVNGDTTTHVWEASNIVLERDGAGDILDTYTYGVSLLKSDNYGYYLNNAHGDVVQLSDDAGRVTRDYHYDAFGVESSKEEDDRNPFRYTSEYYDVETGSIYLRARYYQPTIARFISEDTFTGNSDDPLSLNRYTYGHNNPIKYIDPSGHFVLSSTALLYALVAGTVAVGGLLVMFASDTGNYKVRDSGNGSYLVQGYVSGNKIYVNSTTLSRNHDLFKNTKTITSESYDRDLKVKVHVDEDLFDRSSDLYTSLLDNYEFYTGAKLSSAGKDNLSSKDTGGSNKPSLKPYKNNKEANKQAGKQGYKDAHELKDDFVPRNGSQHDMKYDTKTGEIYLENKAGTVQIPTGLYHIN